MKWILILNQVLFHLITNCLVMYVKKDFCRTLSAKIARNGFAIIANCIVVCCIALDVLPFCLQCICIML